MIGFIMTKIRSLLRFHRIIRFDEMIFPFDVKKNIDKVMIHK